MYRYAEIGGPRALALQRFLHREYNLSQMIRSYTSGMIELIYLFSRRRNRCICMQKWEEHVRLNGKNGGTAVEINSETAAVRAWQRVHPTARAALRKVDLDCVHDLEQRVQEFSLSVCF